MSPRRTKRAARAIAAALALCSAVAGCSDVYFDRRESIALSAGDAVAGNAVAQTVDPWPPHSGNTNIAFNGQRMQSAVEHYRLDRVAPPVDPMMMQVAGPSLAPPLPASPQGGSAGGSAPTGGGQP
jgi:hypothetical protein